jgi:NAD(P)-dependent dehydrogenase (short-subunit alcohol dehydrogenase family)
MLAAYCAAKAGVNGLVRALAAELRGTGVTANSVSPGSTAQQPLSRLIRPEEVAGTIAWLAGEANQAVTGAAIPVDGGLSL